MAASKLTRVIEIVAFAPVLGALLLASLPVLLAISLCRRFVHPCPLNA